jgi:hypothetical protein
MPFELDDLQVNAQHLGPLPLAAAIIHQLGIVHVLDELLPKDPRSNITDSDCIDDAEFASCSPWGMDCNVMTAPDNAEMACNPEWGCDVECNPGYELDYYTYQCVNL